MSDVQFETQPVETAISPYINMLEERLRRAVGGLKCDPLLKEAMAYALEGGKRLRGSIVLAFSEALGGSPDGALDFAAAVEMVHAYSLVHDDLPCMDNDDYRRGRLSCHKKYGYATALLVGDALLTLAFEAIGSSAAPPGLALSALQELAQAAGASGMVGGQVMDLALTPKDADPDRIREMYRLKTGAMFRASAAIGAIMAGAGEEEVQAARDWGSSFGYAFQILDDFEDAALDRERGKAVLAGAKSPEEVLAEAREALLSSRRHLQRLRSRIPLAEAITRHYLEVGRKSGREANKR